MNETGNLGISSKRRRGVLLVNLGSPDSPAVEDVRRYLKQFLMDRNVIDVPAVLRWTIVNLFVLPTRPKRSAEAYRSIWRPEGSPLVVTSERVRARVAEGLGMPVSLAMRYGNPSIRKGLEDLIGPGSPRVEEILLVPLYPHYAMSTIGSTVDETRKALRRINSNIRLEVLPPFYEDERYIEALAASMRESVDRGFDHLLFSYHGLPERHLRKTDPTGRHCLASPSCCETPSRAHATCYRHQVMRTTKLVADKLGLPREKHSVAFQSRLGRDKWLEPSTASELARLARSGVARLLVVSPAFVSDCLETLEEIAREGRKTFLEAGGRDYEFIPCLNEHPAWIGALREWCERPAISPAHAEAAPVHG
jgi:ferrochelatase